MKNNDYITIIAQGFYGNRTVTQVGKGQIDQFILGYMDASISRDEETDRTVVRVPDSENLVIVYNRYEEERRLDYKRQCLAEDGYELKPLAVIPEQGIILYSRCIGCRMNINGELESLEEGDFALFMDYLAE